MSGQGLTIGVDVGGTKTLCAVVDESGAVVEASYAPTPDEALGAAALEAAVVRAVEELAGGRPLAGVGVAAAGFVDTSRSRVVFAPHLAWRDSEVRTRLSSALGAPVALDNDANCAALAESEYGAAKGRSSALVITLGTGIGGAVLIEGRLWRGATGMAGEFGHMQVVPEGRPCECGQVGCWEQYCSGRAVARAMGLDPSSGVGATIAAGAAAGDSSARAAYEEVGRWLGRGVTALVAAFDPEVVVVGGGAAAAGDLLLEPARQVLRTSLVGAGHRRPPDLVTAQLGPQAGAIGAALLAQQDASDA